MHDELPVHPRTGLMALAIGKRGPIWPVFGAEDPPAGGPPANDPPKQDPPKETDFKPITSQDDLNRIIGERVARERAKYADHADLKKKADAYDKAVADAQSEQEKAVAKARDEGKNEGLSAGNTRLVRSEARAIAAELKFKNPSAAVKLVADELANVKVSDDGEVDEDAIKAALTELAKSDTYLIDDGVKPPPKKDPSQGGAGGDPKASTVEKGRELFNARRKPAKSSA